MKLKSCFLFFCSTDYQDHLVWTRSRSEFEYKSWYQPDSMSFQFFIGGLPATEGELSGDQEFSRTLGGETLNYTGIPSQSAVSFASELKDPETNEYLPTKVYSSLSRYSLKLRNLTMSSIKTVQTSSDGSTKVTKDTQQSNELLEQAFQTDLVDDVVIQNHVNSPFGRGWKIGGVQKIANPDSNRIVLENEDGSASVYSLSNSIETVLNGNDTPGLDLTEGVSLNTYPDVLATQKSGSLSVTQILKFNLSMGQSSQVVDTLPNFEGVLRYESPQCIGDVTSTTITEHAYVLQASTSKLIDLNGGIAGVSDNDHKYFLSYNNDLGQYPITPQLPFVFSGPEAISLCQSYGIDCPVSGSFTEECPGGFGSFQNRSTGTLGLATPQANTPMDIILGTNGLFIMADTGNNRVVQIDFDDPFLQTAIAGNRGNQDLGDGGLATQASMYHPRGLAQDSIGNLYISTENGFIRKVDTSGYITTIAGLPLEEGG